MKENRSNILIEKHSSSGDLQPKLRQTTETQTHSKASEHYEFECENICKNSK